jgi:hypothetical protein
VRTRATASEDLPFCKRKGSPRRALVRNFEGRKISLPLLSEYQVDQQKLPTLLGGFGGEVVCFIEALLWICGVGVDRFCGLTGSLEERKFRMADDTEATRLLTLRKLSLYQWGIDTVAGSDSECRCDIPGLGSGSLRGRADLRHRPHHSHLPCTGSEAHAGRNCRCIPRRVVSGSRDCSGRRHRCNIRVRQIAYRRNVRMGACPRPGERNSVCGSRFCVHCPLVSL